MRDKTPLPLHPEVEVPLDDVSGTVYVAASRTRAALKRAGISNEDCVEFFNDALSGDHDHTFATINKWVTIT